MNTALCKFRGMLVLMVTAPAAPGMSGRCPECGSTEFVNGDGWATGWTECAGPDCGFAVLTEHLEEPGDG